jgi:hypothetical protein
VIDKAHEFVGVPPRIDPAEEIAAARGQLEALKEQIAEAASRLGGGARQAARQVEGTAKLYPVSSVLAAAGLAALVVLAVSGIRSATPPRKLSERFLDELQDLYDRTRRHF